MALSLDDCLRLIGSVIETKELISGSVEAVDFRVDGIEGKVIAAFAVFRLVENRRIDDFDFAGTEIALEVPFVIICVPEALFHIGIQLQVLILVSFIGDGDVLDLAGIVHRNEAEYGRPDLIQTSGEPAVSEAMPAFIEIQVGPHRLPSGIPDRAAIADIQVMAVIVIGNIIVAIASDAKQFRIFIE